MKKLILALTMAIQVGCSTMKESLQLGASMGAIVGAAAVHAAHSSSGKPASLEDMAAGAGIGLGLGLLTSHIIHKSVEEDRKSYQFDQVEMHFGDLPPSPFIMPKPVQKKGGR